MPNVHSVFRGEQNEVEGALLAPLPPPPRNERRGEEIPSWEVVDDFVDNLLGK